MKKIESNILSDLNALKRVDKKTLHAFWVECFGSREKPSSHDLTIRYIARHVQEKAYGGLPARTRTQLNRLVAGRVQAPIKKYELLPNTILKREWNGQTYIIYVHDKKRLEYNGREYRSLSTIAKVITGSHWSGPLFFGLRKDKRGKE